MDLPARDAAGLSAGRHLCAEAWFAVPVNGGLETLMLLRPPHDGGFWQGVSGTVDPEDRTWEGVLEREVLEETGIPPSAYTLVDLNEELEFEGVFSKRPFRKRVFALHLHASLDAEDVVLSDEHIEVRRVTFDAALGLVRFDDHRRLLKKAHARCSARLP